MHYAYYNIFALGRKRVQKRKRSPFTKWCFTIEIRLIVLSRWFCIVQGSSFWKIKKNRKQKLNEIYGISTVLSICLSKHILLLKYIRSCLILSIPANSILFDHDQGDDQNEHVLPVHKGQIVEQVDCVINWPGWLLMRFRNDSILKH